MITRRFLLCLTAIVLSACQNQAPAEQPGATPEAPAVKAAEAGAPAGAVGAADAVDVPPIPGVPSELAGKIVPAGVDWFGAVDLRALKGTILDRQFHPWLRYVEALPDYQRVMGETGAGNLLGHTLILGGTFAPETALGFDLFAAVFGLKDETKMSSWVAARIAEKGPSPAKEFKTGNKDGIAWVGGPSLSPKVEALLIGGGGSVNDDDAWVELQRAINTKAPLWALVRIPELLRAQFPLLHQALPGLQFFPGVNEVLGMTHAAVSLDLGDRLEVRAAIKLGSAEDAQVVLEQIQMAAEATLWEPTLFFDAFQLHAAGSLVTLNAATSKKAWRVAVFWLSIAAQAAAFEEMRPRMWEKDSEMKMEEKAPY
ncbi:MAG: hypothetical protein ABIK09_16935 [Pseudomonadota bacterium]